MKIKPFDDLIVFLGRNRAFLADQPIKVRRIARRLPRDNAQCGPGMGHIGFCERNQVLTGNRLDFHALRHTPHIYYLQYGISRNKA